MGLIDIFTALDTPLKAAVGTLFPGQTFTHDFGADQEVKQSVAPRIVWIPFADRWGPPQQSNRDANGGNGRLPRHLFLVQETVRVRFWATPDNAAVKALIQTFVQQMYALQVYGGRTFMPTDGEWDKGNSQLTRFGLSYHLMINFGIPVTDQQPVLALVTDIPQTNTINFPDPPPAGHSENV